MEEGGGGKRDAEGVREGGKERGEKRGENLTCQRPSLGSMQWNAWRSMLC